MVHYPSKVSNSERIGGWEEVSSLTLFMFCEFVRLSFQFNSNQFLFDHARETILLFLHLITFPVYFLLNLQPNRPNQRWFRYSWPRKNPVPLFHSKIVGESDYWEDSHFDDCEWRLKSQKVQAMTCKERMKVKPMNTVLFLATFLIPLSKLFIVSFAVHLHQSVG